jgi:hypothetical protein
LARRACTAGHTGTGYGDKRKNNLSGIARMISAMGRQNARMQALHDDHPR